MENTNTRYQLTFTIDRQALPAKLRGWDLLIFNPAASVKPDDCVVAKDAESGLRVLGPDASKEKAEIVGPIMEGRRSLRQPAPEQVTVRSELDRPGIL